MKSRIFYTKPSITDLEISYATDAATNGWGEKCYEYITRFENAFKHHLGVKHAIATSSCTGALHMGLAAMGINTEDEIILADINWIATVAPIIHLGARPVFVDILSDSWCLAPELVKEAITSRTKAIIATHLYGNLCEMQELRLIGDEYGIPIIEDAAEAIGSIYHGKRAGSIGTFGVFSFHGTKTITAGEGGMFVTNDDDLYEKVLTLSNHGRNPYEVKQFWPETIGFKYKMSNIQAAIGCAQMVRLEKLLERKRQIFFEYKKELADQPLLMNPEPEGIVNGFWMPTILINDGVAFDRNRALLIFKNENIDGRAFFWPLSSLPMFREKRQNKQSYGIHCRAMNLPSYHDISADDIERVVMAVKKSIGEHI